jgi:Putative beta-barrel porin-2, OmpL-like. bbp2
MRITVGRRFTSKLAAPAALAMLLSCGTVAWAQSSASSESVSDLKSEVQELRKEIRELKGEVTTIKTQAAIVPTPPADQKAMTIGEHVGSIGKDLSSLKSDLSTNLGVHIHGLVDTTYEYNFNQPKTYPPGGSGRTNQLRVFDTNANSFDLEQFNLHVDRTADGGVGFVTDLNFGEVANALSAATHYSNAFGLGSSEIDVTQAYLTYTVPFAQGINLSLGKFVTLLGEEVIPTWNGNNFNISRSFAFGYTIPFTHTGLRAQYSFNDYVGATLGVNNGWDDVSDNNDGKTIEGQLALNSGSLMSENQSLAFTLSGIWGAEQPGQGNSHRWVINPILTYNTPIKGLALVGEFVYGEDDGTDYVSPYVTSQGNSITMHPVNPWTGAYLVENPSWASTAGYIVYDWTDNLELALRGEWFRDSDGARTGLRQTLAEVTGTVNYKIPYVSGLLARLEYRHDESSAKPFYTNAGINPLTGVPYQTIAGQDTVMAAAVYSF